MMISNIMWGWLICGLIVAVLVRIDYFLDKNEDKINKLTDEQKMMWEKIGGIHGVMMLAVLLGPIGLLTVIMDEE